MHVTIHGKRWRLRFCKLDGETLGECNSPDTPRKEIRIDESLTGQKKLDTLIHELRHAASWHVDEDAIDVESSAITACLWKLGLRWQNEE